MNNTNNYQPRGHCMHHLRISLLHRPSCPQWCPWSSSSRAFPSCYALFIRLVLRQVRCHRSYDHCSLLARHSNVHWLHCCYSDDPSYLAFVSRHPQPHSRVSWYHDPADGLSLNLLVYPIPNPAHSTTQASMVLHIQVRFVSSPV